MRERIIQMPWQYRGAIGTLILRVGVALMMLSHGVPKLVLLMQGRGAQWMDPLGMGATLSLALCCFAEFGCSLAILAGVFTRVAAFVLAVNFWVVITCYGGERFWPQNELPMLYLVCFLSLLCSGSGALSLDAYLRRRRKM